VYPIVEELAVLKRSRQLLIGTGGGTRARHVYSVAAELGLPTGVLTDAGAAVAGQNAKMLGYLMARYGVPTVGHEAFGALPLYIAECGAAIFPGMDHGTSVSARGLSLDLGEANQKSDTPLPREPRQEWVIGHLTTHPTALISAVAR